MDRSLIRLSVIAVFLTAWGPFFFATGALADVSGSAGDDVDMSASAPDETASPEITAYSPAEAPLEKEILSEDPLDPAETAATIAVVQKDGTPSAEAGMDETPDTATPVSPTPSPRLPFGKGEMALAVGLGGYGSDGFTLTAGAIFDYFVIDRLAPGIEITYQATFGDVKYPQDFSVFPYLKYVFIRSNRIAPYLLAGGGRTLEWGGADPEVSAATGEFFGYAAVGSWFTGMGGGIIIGVGMRLRIQVQLLAMYRVFDEEIWTDTPTIEGVVVRDSNGLPIATTYRMTGKKTDRQWYPAPSFWISFAL